MIMKRKQPPHQIAITQWFKQEMIPKRTVSAGFSANRVWLGPRSLWVGNESNPNGLCGDCTQYVYENFWAHFGGLKAANGCDLKAIWWEGPVFNHIANILAPPTMGKKEKFRYDKTKNRLVSVDNEKAPANQTIMNALVLDLYYKKVQTVRQWWMDLDKLDDTITIAGIYDF